MTRGNVPIAEAPLAEGLHTGLAYPLPYEEFESCVAAGLDLYRWETGGYPVRFKNRVVAWHRTHRLVEAHVNDAQAKEMKKKSRS